MLVAAPLYSAPGESGKMQRAYNLAFRKETPMQPQTPLAQATRTVNARIGFGIHLTAYVLVNALLIAINLMTTPDRLWFQWPLAGWGIGLAFHGLAVLGMTQGRAMKAELIKKELRQQGR